MSYITEEAILYCKPITFRGCTGFDGYGKACVAGEVIACPLNRRKTITEDFEDETSDDNQLALAA